MFGGDRVPKDDARVRAYGEVDETNAAIGFAAALEPAGFALASFQTIQRDLFSIGASEVGAIEDLIDTNEATLPPLKNFILPGGTPKAAALQLARTTCRRAERSVVSLARGETINPAIIHYLNRLSDLLFVLARAVNKQAGRPDVAW